MKKWAMTIASLCVTACLLAGCGGEESGGSSSSTLPAATLPAATPTAVPVQTAKAVKVTATDGLNIRSEASTSGEILGLADNGELLPLLVEEEKDGWYQIEYEGKPAFVSAEYAQVQEVTLEEYNRLRGAASSSSSAPPSSDEGSSSGTAEATPTPPAGEESSSSQSSSGSGNLEDGE